MQQITELVRQAVRNGERLEAIKQRILDGLVNATLVKTYGNQTKAAEVLGMNRMTIRRTDRSAPRIASKLTYREAWHHVCAVAVTESLSMRGDSVTAAAKALGCSRYMVWRYGK